MRLFLKTRSAEVETAILLFAVGWIAGMSGGFLPLDPIWVLVSAITLMASGVALLFHASYARQLFNMRLSEVKAAVVLFSAGWIGVMVGCFFDLGGWMIIVLAHGLLAGGAYLLIRASYEKQGPV